MKRAEAIKKLQAFSGQLKEFGATALYLFGSTVRGQAEDKSDIDLFIDYDPRGTFSAFDLVATKRILQRELGVEIDLTTRKGLHPLILKKIEAEAVRIF